MSDRKRFSARGRTLPAYLGLSVAYLAFACGTASEVEIEGRRIVSASSRPVSVGASLAQRLGVTDPQATQSPLLWTLPIGWQELEASGMRIASLRPGGHPDADCSLTILGQDGGGMANNVNRWRDQMGLEPLSAEEVDELPLVTLLGTAATRVELRGDYTGMGGEGRPNWGLLGAILIADRFTIFVKMTGPVGLIEVEGSAFDAFCASVRVRMPAQQEGGPPPSSQSADGAAPATATDSQTAGAGSVTNYDFDLPAGWRELSPSGMRIVNLTAGTASQCYVVELVGAGGGLTANINRWNGQVGADPIDATAAEALPTVTCLGQDCTLVELTDEDLDSALLGVLLIRTDGSLFVKMIGPREELLAERDAFVSFVTSLEVAQ